MKKIIKMCSLLIIVSFIFIIGCKKTVTITFDATGGSSVEAMEIDKDSTIATIPTSTKAGYAFNGWYLDGVKINSLKTFSKDTTVTAEWISNLNTITFCDTDGTIIEEQNVRTGDKITPPEYTPKDGYTFVGWDTSLSSITSSTIVTAVCVEIQYSITFVSNGGSLVANINQVYNGEITQPKDPIKSEYFFAGWYIDEDLTKIYKFSTMPNYSFTLYAKWDEVGVDYASIYLDSLSSLKNINTSADYALPTELTLEGKKFTISWEVEITEGNNDVSVVTSEGMVTININENLTVECKYTLKATITAGTSSIINTYSRIIPVE